MTPSAPVLDFKFPKFADNGFTEWIIEGGKGIYDSDEQIRIEDMALRVYSGDERMVLEMTLDSPEATVRIQENRAFSEGSIVIVGSNFKISGVGWQWDGKTKQIELHFDVLVEFSQNLGNSLVGGDISASVFSEQEGVLTVIRSETLRLTTSEADYKFEFENSVEVASSDLNLKSELLVAYADAPKGRKKKSVEVDKLDAVREVIATEEVVITQAARVIRADLAEFYPREKRALLTGAAKVEAEGVYLSGNSISTKEGEVIIQGSSDFGRSQMILLETGGLGIQGAAALSDETIVLADTIKMLQGAKRHQFIFDGAVEVMSGEVQMNAASMNIFTKEAARKKASGIDATKEPAIKVGSVESMVARGGVRIERGRQLVTSEMVEFFPDESRAVLTGSPKVESDEATVIGVKMELEPGLAIVRGSDGNRVKVVLPVLPDLGYDGLDSLNENSPKSSASIESQTVVQSVSLRMVEEATQTRFRFSDQVQVEATNLVATCEQLEVIATKKEGTDTKGPEDLEVAQIIASRSVKVEQSGRIATADKALIQPREGTIILEGNAVVNDDRGRVSGHRMILNKGKRNAIVEGGGPKGERAKITLPDFKR